MERDKIPSSVMPFTTGILIDNHRAMEDVLTYTIEVKKAVRLEGIWGEIDRVRRGNDY